MNDKDRLRSKQTFAEFKNLERRIKHFERTVGSAPTTLFERKAALERRLNGQNRRVSPR